MEWIIALAGAIAGAGVQDMPASCLLRMDAALQQSLSGLAAMAPVADQAAARLAKGGKLWAAGQASLVSEISGRAGGIMMIRGLRDEAPGIDDVILYTPEPGAKPDLPDTQALVIVFGAPVEGREWPAFANHAQETHLSPTLANAIPAWIFTGELIAALTRLGKMPVVYESVGAYGGNARMGQYKNGEIAFHEDRIVPAVAPGVIGRAFVETVSRMLERVERQERGKLDRAGDWVRDAKAQGKRLFMYSMGHLFPDEVGKTDIGKVFHSDVWNAGFRQSAQPEDTFAPGDVAIHIGYQHPPDELLRRACPAGARVVYVSVRPDRDYTDADNALWIDPMWDWPDACVPLEGYDVPLLAASGIINGAIAWEIFRLGVEPPSE